MDKQLYDFGNDLSRISYGIKTDPSKSFKKFITFLENLEPIKLQIFIDINLNYLQQLKYTLKSLI